MQLFFRGLEQIEVLEVSQDATIADVKNQLAQVHGFNTEEIALNCEGMTLVNDYPVTGLNSFELDITIPMLGGKVHGSLARAGKVKGQTPKVEKQEKKKKKTGRAKRRIQYNRRFVNIVQGFGRRRGPNANST
ncbi:ubiquitin-like FUBI-ribosomal protein eS30 fusion protein [Drosophila tropicalis]|uniref:ubiquitin-like FUBI-ribosomal protein eS30 fusion protein n=1 Tax=Drosophila tropicalis TaxID=46794 RepID=UPI0035AB6EFA